MKTDSKKILILCTGNSCRSQMAEGFLRSFNPSLEVFSAGTHPSGVVHPMALSVMSEAGMDIAGQVPENVEEYLGCSFDFLITVCDDARENCPAFSGAVKKRLHIGFIDPAAATGTEEEILAVFRKVRDEIRQEFELFNNKYILGRKNENIKGSEKTGKG